jgi:hypothetical protein
MPDNATTTTGFVANQVTTVTAATMPLWLHVMSDWAQIVLPIMGVIVLVIQASTWVYKTFIRKRPTK